MDPPPPPTAQNLPLGCVRFQNQVEWNGTVPFLRRILAFGFEMEWNQLIPQNGIFAPDAEYTRPADSAGRGGTGDYHRLINQV